MSSDREKGAPPPDYMPAIFGWMTSEEMEEHAREIVDFVKKIKPKKKNRTNLRFFHFVCLACLLSRWAERSPVT